MKIKISQYTDNGYKHTETCVDDAVENFLDDGARGRFMGRLVNMLVDKQVLDKKDLELFFGNDVEITFLDLQF